MRKRNIDWLPLTCPQLGTWPATQACALTGNRTGDLSCHRLALNPLSHTSQDTFSLPFHLSMDTSYFHVLAIVVNAAINLEVQISL